jgi:DNA polymerase III epsilon subunit-like protein
MVLGSRSEPLSRLEVLVLVVDCQATAAAPRGHLLEIGWAQVRNTVTHPRACLIALPDGKRIPPAVSRITGISEHMMRAAVDRQFAWRAASDQAASLAQQPAPTVIHFARFEQPFLRTLGAGRFPLDVVCTRDIARRLLPDLPRRSLRALAGYFGRAVGALRRSADHVEATAFIWQELVRLLETKGVSTWSALHDWLALRLLRSSTGIDDGAEALDCSWRSSGAAPGRRTGTRRVATRVCAVVDVMRGWRLIDRWTDRLSAIDVWASTDCETVVHHAIMQ